MIIGRAGGPGDEPIEKVAGTEERISLLGGENAQHTTGVLLNLLLMHCVCLWWECSRRWVSN